MSEWTDEQVVDLSDLTQGKEALDTNMGKRIDENNLEDEEDDIWDAVTSNDIDSLRRQLRSGVSPNLRNPVDGRTLLIQAAAMGYKDMVKVLVNEFDADLLKTSWMGKDTALHFAAQHGHRATVFQLLSLGLLANQQNKFGMTPLHYSSCVNVARVLVQFGSQAIIRDNVGRLALDCALEQTDSSPEFISYLTTVTDEHMQESHRKFIRQQRENQALKEQLARQREAGRKQAEAEALQAKRMAEYRKWKE